ncbi:hypothetical protein BDA96_10G183300 [Sorghum bicolor]|uniref:BolA-like protein n=2 Tax=Sorghum bicolor TaxID=4558 RepID=A0A921U1B4_SORBI|nr:protein BOLA4, chloroplastic/mitochondrial [Sorghum bicolor]EER89755.1 hypothetical protein SORBI_3010G140600 [Sorghum bicolor]KAG0514346.1 hypothetical protein BDA96_10G183300 [Sorghum bicolor]|eukprot:XP_002438388.1 protein BOLA4, chloroplastic/mitochondrial [Sorghum bicolor]
MLPLRSAAAAPCLVAGLLLHRFSSCSSSSVYSVRHHASYAVSSQPSTCPTTTWFPFPHSSSPRIRGFAAWASAPGQAGSADSPATKALEAKIKEQLQADTVTVVDTSGDGRHVCIDVVSKVFEGKSAVNRQRMVYKAIWEELQSTVHAVDQMTTKTPDEAGAK